ncbi:2-dehydropantoate 2-reductase [candidate division KSB1 bacterium]|nr:2-dehydropantoate 2-reductase [candidate division KSB1 bacterium]
MKIAIVGAGGVGGYYGALLARAGHEVTFIARGEHLQALRAQGLQVRSILGDFAVSPVRATATPVEIGPVDLIVVAVKTYHLDEAAQMLTPLLAPTTVVLPFENGVDAVERLGAVIGQGPMLGGATWISAAIEAPGVIGHYSLFRRVVLGEFNGQVTPRLQATFEAFQRTGISVEISADIRTVLWSKLVFIAAVGAIGSLTRVTFGEFHQVNETRVALKAAIAEIIAVGQANGAKLQASLAEDTLAFIDKSAAELKPSLQRDIEAGRVSELESLIGVVVRLGAEAGVPTPVMSLAYAMLKPGLLKAQGKLAMVI